MKRSLMLAVVLTSVMHAALHAADAPKPAAKPAKPAPTQANVKYGDHERQVLDLYQAQSARPTPLVFFIHGGGWVAGDKSGVNPTPYLANGVSVVAINYRYSWQAQLDGVKPPVKAPLEDAARALQFVRSKAKEWNIDKARIGASGGSAGACSSLWLAFHKDMADPKSSDPIARESTRLWTAAVNGAQTSLDPKELKEWTPNSRYGGHAFGFMDPKDLKTRDTRFAEFLEHREELLPLINEYSPIALVTADDPPVYLFYGSAPALGQEQKDPTHTANYGVKLQEKCRSLDVGCELVYPEAPNVKHKSIDDYLVADLKGPPRRVMKPTIADLRYGPAERNVLDFYQAKSDKPTPLVFHIHGGGWMGGDKNGINPKPFLDAGISVASVNYRYIWQAQDVVPPVKAPLHDAARALQFVRSKAAEWNIDKTRIGATGGSAGACSSLWLAFHDDLADPKSDDPIARESTRLWCAAVGGAQTTLDPKQMKEWMPNSSYGGHAFKFNGNKEKNTTQFDEFLAGREKILPWIAEYSPYALVTSDDPPVYLQYGPPPAKGKEMPDPTHSANFGALLQEHCREKGVDCELFYNGAPDVKHSSTTAYLIAVLKAPTAKAGTEAKPAAATPKTTSAAPPTPSRPQHPTRPFDAPGAPKFTRLDGKPGVNPPIDADGDFVVGPVYVAAPETKVVAGVPQGKVAQFTIDSKNCKLFNPGIARKVFGTVDPNNPKTLIVETHEIDYTRTVTVYVPAQYKPGTAAPFIVGHDGPGMGKPDLTLPRILDNLIAQKRVPAMIAILISSGGGDAQGHERGREYDTMSGLYAEFIENEVLPLVEKNYDVKLTKDPEGRATMGNSSGGSAALIMAWYRPDLYHRVLTFSGTFVNQQWPFDPKTPGGAWDFHDKLIPESEKKPLRIWMAVGDRDLLNPNVMRDGMHDWVEANNRMAKVLKAKGYPYQYLYCLDAGHGIGNARPQILPNALEWLWKGYTPKE